MNSHSANSMNDVMFIYNELGLKEGKTYTFEWCDSILQTRYKQPIIFNFDIEIQKVLSRQIIDLNLFKLIVRHLFINYKSHYYLVKHNLQTEDYMFSDPIHINDANKLIFTGDINIVYNNTFFTTNIQTLLKKFRFSMFNADKKKLELTNEDNKDTTYITYTLENLGDKSKTFADRPKAIDFILHSMLDNTTTGLTQEQLNERVNYFESFIAYKFQHPGAHIIHAIIVDTEPGVGKSIYARILREINPHVKDNDELDRALQQFNSGSGDNIITFFNEVADTNQHSKLKAFITEKYIPTEVKFGPRSYELNNNLKIFYTNEKSFSFLGHNDRRFIVMLGTKTQEDVEQQYNIPGFIFDNPAEDIINSRLKDEYFNYLIDLDLKDFNPNMKSKSFAITCNKQEMIEKHLMGEDNLTNFINMLLDKVKTAEVDSNLKGVSNKKCISANHLLKLLDLFKETSNIETNNLFDNLLDNSVSLINNSFTDVKHFEELREIYNRDFKQDTTMSWSTTSIGRKMRSNTKIDIKRLRESQLIIPAELKEFYIDRVMIYIINH